MANRYTFALGAAAGCVLASLSGCVATTTTGQNGVTITVNGVNVSTSAGANSAAETVQKKFIAGSVTTLKASTTAGSIEIKAADSGPDEIHVQATKTIHGNDPSEKLKTLLSSVTVQAELVDGALVLSSTQPADFEKRNISVTVDYLVTVPPRLAMDLRSGSGSLTVSGVQGGGKLHTDYGSIDLKDVGAVLDISTNSGAISIYHAPLSAKTTVKSSYGNIILHEIAGNIDAETESGTITAKSTDAAKSGTGNIKLRSGYGDVNISEATGTVDAASSSGVVRISDSRLTDQLTLHSEYGNVEATNVTSVGQNLRVELTTSSGSATYRGEASDLTLRSDYGTVDGELGGALTLRGANLHSSSGSVSLLLPASASASVEASTSSGTVELPSGQGGNSGSVKLGGGAAQVKLESEYGNVVLRTK